MSITTILLIGGGVAIMLLMHRVGHGGHAGSHGAGGNSAHAGSHGAGGDGVVDGDHAGDGEEGQASAGQRQKKHGCC